MSHSELKQRSKELILKTGPKPATPEDAKANPNPIIFCLLFLLVSMILSTLSNRLTGVNITDDQMAAYLSLVQAQNYEKAYSYALTLIQTPSLLALLLDAAVRLLQMILYAGLIIFLLHTIRATGEACFGNLLDGFAIFLRVILVSLLVGALVLLGSFLIVPGIIFSYQYRLAFYLVIDHSELSVINCMKKSRELMKGKKWDLFLLDLSFLGWILLSILPPVQIWTTPYMQTTYLLYYLELLKADTEPLALPQ